MNWFEKLRQAYNQYLPLSNYVIVLLLLLPVYPVIRQSVISTNSHFVEQYSHFIQQGSVLIGQLVGLEQHELLNIFLSQTTLDTRFMALWQTLLFLLGICFLHTSAGRRILLGLTGLITIYLFNSIRWLILSVAGLTHAEFSVNIWNGTMVAMLNAALLLFAYWWWKRNFPLKRLIVARLQVAPPTLRKIIRNLLIVSVLLIITQWVTYTQTLPLVSWISKGVLEISKALLAVLGYTTYLSGRYIYTREAAIFFSDTCAGIELMLIYASFIAILNGKHKVLFIAGGIFIIFFMNVLRISLIMIYLIHHHGHYSLPINIHDLYSYPVYGVTFILWTIWIHFFNRTESKIQA